MDVMMFQRWLEAYKRAWETRDAEAAARLFTPDVVYSRGLFPEFRRGRHRIEDAWCRTTARQTDIRFEYDILAVTPTIGLNTWRVAFTLASTGERLQSGGLFAVWLTDEGLCDRYDFW